MLRRRAAVAVPDDVGCVSRLRVTICILAAFLRTVRTSAEGSVYFHNYCCEHLVFGLQYSLEVTAHERRVFLGAVTACVGGHQAVGNIKEYVTSRVS